jgi:hypothetical protein
MYEFLTAMFMEYDTIEIGIQANVSESYIIQHKVRSSILDGTLMTSRSSSAELLSDEGY